MLQPRNRTRRSLVFTGFILLSILLAPTAQASMPAYGGPHTASMSGPAVPNHGSISLSFVGNHEVILYVSVSPNDSNYIHWGELGRNGSQIRTFPGGFDDYYTDSGLTLGQNFEYQIKAFRKDRASGEVTLVNTSTKNATTGQVSGIIWENMTWSGSWHITTTLGTWGVDVRNGAKLTIAPGATVYMDSFAHVTGIRLWSDSQLEVRGATLRNLDITSQDSSTTVMSIRNCTLDNSDVSTNNMKAFDSNSGSCHDEIRIKNRPGFANSQYSGNSLPNCDLVVDFGNSPVLSNLTLANNRFSSLDLRGITQANVTVQDNVFSREVQVNWLGIGSIDGSFNFVDNRASRIEAGYITNATFEGNVVDCSDGSFTGFYLYNDIVGAQIISNTIRNCYSAFTLDGLPDHLPHGNTIRGNVAPDGYINISSSDNIIYDNVFKGAYVTSDPPGPNTWNTAKTPGTNIIGRPFLGGNLWSNYSGQDDDGDGIGDTPYVIDDNNVDNLPLVGSLGPDLMVNPLTLNLGEITFESTGRRYILPLDVIVENVGCETTGATSARFSDNGGWSDTQPIPELEPGISATLHLDWDITPILAQGDGQDNIHLTVIADPDGTITDTIRANNTRSNHTWVDARPQITMIEPEYTLEKSYFLDKTDLANLVRVEVDWNGVLPDIDAPPYGNLYFKLNDQEIVKTGEDWGAEHSYDMGKDFNASFSCANNTLRIWAVHPVQGGEFRAIETTTQPTVFPFPGWVKWVIENIPGSDAEFATTPNAPLVEYSYNFIYPEEPFEATWTPPGWVPYLGGEELGILETQASANTRGRSDGTGSARIEGQTGLGLGALTSQGMLWGAGDVEFVCGESLSLKRAELGFSINVSVAKEMGLIELVPGVKAAAEWPIVGRLVNWIVNLAKVKATLTPKIEVKTEFEEMDDQLKFVQGQGTGSVDGSVTLSAGIEGLSAEVSGGGKPYVTIQVPKHPGYFKEIGIDMRFGATIQTGPFDGAWEYKVNCHHPGSCAPVEDPGLLAGPTWHLIERDYAGPSYAVFNGTVSLSTETTAETLLLENVYPYPEPALAVRTDGQRLLTYVQDDLGKPQGRGTEIHALGWNGTAWSSPISVTDDLQPDFSPAVAFDGNGNGLLVWERSALAPGITPTLSITYAQSLEIAYATYDSGSGLWSSPITLTHNALMDHAPQLSTGSDGTVLALWKTHDGTDVLGTAGHPLTLSFALWDGSAWSTPTAALDNLQDVLGVDMAAYSATEATVVYVVDADGLVTTTADSDLYYSSFDGAAWSAPTLIADGAGLIDIIPALAYDAAGNRHLIWLRDETLVWLANSWDLADLRAVRPDSSEAGFLDFSLERDPNGNLAIIWQAMGEDGANLTYSVYDLAANLWGADQVLMSDVDVEAGTSPAFADGTLYAAYEKTEIEFVTQTYEISPGVYFTVSNMPLPGESDLAFLEHTVGRDLTFDSLGITPGNPHPGQAVTLTAILRNAGDLAVAAAQVGFYDGPSAIATSTLPLTLAGGYTTTVEIAWTLPITPVAAHSIRAVADPSGLVAESDESNNEIALETTLPDLQIDLLYTDHGPESLTLTARLVNAGALEVVDPFTVTFRLTDPLSGTLVATATVDHSIAAGDRLVFSQCLTDAAFLRSLAGLDGPLWATVDAGDAVIEADETNNVIYALFGIQPDLTLSAEDIQGNGPVQVTVHNEGLITATQVVLAVWQDSLSGTLVYSDTLPDLGPGAGHVVSFDPPVGQFELWAKADPDNAIPEMNESNNLAIREVVGTIAWRIYLPLVMKD